MAELNFRKEIKNIYKDIPLEDFFDKKCPFCGLKRLTIRSIRIHEVPDLESPTEKIIARILVPTFVCQSCSASFSPDHPDFPTKYEYSQAIIEYALLRYHYRNDSNNLIAGDFALLHNVDVPEVTVYSWLRQHSPEFIKARLARNPKDLPLTIKAFTVDGTYFSTGADIIGKKKAVESLSVTRLANRDYLLMW